MMSLQEHNDECAARYAQPDPKRREINGRTWSRTLPIRCPICRNIFFAWELAGNDHWDNPMVSPAGSDHREVCGHPLCREAEQKRVLQLQPGYQAARSRGHAEPQDKPKPSGLARLN